MNVLEMYNKCFLRKLYAFCNNTFMQFINKVDMFELARHF